jgi:hypothetical protein
MGSRPFGDCFEKEGGSISFSRPRRKNLRKRKKSKRMLALEGAKVYSTHVI